MPAESWNLNDSLLLDQASVCRQTHLSLASAHDNEWFSEPMSLWESLFSPPVLPFKRDFSPFSISPKLLPFILIMDVLRDPLQYQYRLTGTRMDRIHNKNLTGTFVSDLRPKEVRTDLENDLAVILDTLTPQFVQLEFTNSIGNHRDFKVLRLPLRSDEGTENRVDHILVVTDAD